MADYVGQYDPNRGARYNFGGIRQRNRTGLTLAARGSGQSPDAVQNFIAQHRGLQNRLQNQMTDVERLRLANTLNIDPVLLGRSTGRQGFGTGGFGFNANQRQKLRAAAGQEGGLQQLIAANGNIAGQLGQLTPEQRKQLARMLQTNEQQFAVPPAPGSPTAPPVPGTNTPPKPKPEPTPMDPDVFKAFVDGYTPNATSAETGLNNLYTQGLSRFNAVPQASYEDMFKNYQAVADREAARQAAAINESFGSRGARYSSDMLNAQSDLRARMAAEGRVAADQFTQQLNNQRRDELGMYGQGAAQLGALDVQRKKMGQDLFQLDYLRNSSPGPLFEGSTNYAQSFGNPNYVVG